MNEQELRAIVRRIVAEHMGHGAAHPPAQVVDVHAHASHALLRVSAGAESGGPCVIEPHVPCDHCGYCKSLGH